MQKGADPDLLRRRLLELETEVQGLRERIAEFDDVERLGEIGFGALVCRVGDQPIAFLERDLDEVVRVARLAPVSEAPPWVSGLLNLRGETVLVVDVQARLDRSRRRLELGDLIVIGRATGRRVGLVVSETTGLVRVAPGALGPVPRGPATEHFALGVVPAEASYAVLLSVPALVGMALDLDEGR